MATAIFRKIIEQEQALRGRVLMDSAGTSAAVGSSATYEANVVMREYGLSLEGHQSKLVSKELVDRADLILVMESKHKNKMLQNFGEAEGKIHLLSEFVGEKGEIIDPIWKGVDVYRSTARQIELYLLKLKDNLMENINPQQST